MPYSASNTYATLAQVEGRITAHGAVHAADVDWQDGVVDSVEEDRLEAAIEYANGLIDEALAPWVEISPRPSVAWLTDRCIDIACYRYQTIGGREADKPFIDDYTAAIDKLEEVRLGTLKVPGLDYSEITTNGTYSGWPFRAVNIRRC